MNGKTVIVGMSGGVDSSVAAYLLQEEGYKVIGLFMKNWEEEGSSCQAAEDFEDANRVADLLGIPLYTIDFTKEYWDRVFATFLEELKQGYTPNPDILCNREIKFSCLMEKVEALQGDFLATGHYCRVNGSHQLLRGIDQEKDQTYFLYAIEPSALKKTLFPIGHLTKTEVRALAKKRGIPTHQKKDSTGICFIGKRNFKEFISHYIPYHPGNFETVDGKVVGKHDGAAYYTLGQRKGLGIGGAGPAWFVVAKDLSRNVVVVAQGDDHPALYATSLQAISPNFLEKPPSFPFRCTAKIRYRQKDEPCLIEENEDGSLQITFDQPQRAVTPRQSIVFYQDELCLGGAFIENAK